MSLALTTGLLGVDATRACADELGEAIEVVAEATTPDQTPEDGIEVQAEETAPAGGAAQAEAAAQPGDEAQAEIPSDEAGPAQTEADAERLSADGAKASAAKADAQAAAKADEASDKSVHYLDENGDDQSVDAYTDISDDGFKGTTLGDGWYVVKRGKRTFSDRIEVTGDAKLILCDDTEGYFSNGIRCERGSLTVYGQKGGSGKLTAISNKNRGAGIGSNEKQANNGTITIVGGTIKARGGSYAAGIGGGDQSGAGTIRILGGSVEAYGKSLAITDSPAGIGSGSKAPAGGTVEISGGHVFACTTMSGAGIGSGCKAKAPVDVTISGGEVDAHGGEYAAGIGGGDGVGGGTITITGGEVRARTALNTIVGDYCNGEHSGAAIGGGQNGVSGTIRISGGTVEAVAVKDGAGIGGGHKGDSETILISGDAVVRATSGANAAGIGGGNHGKSGKISISDDADVTANAGGAYAESAGAGIGGGCKKPSSEITISGNAKVQATGGTNDAAGIGGGADADGGRITICDSANVTAQGGKNGAGIGGGDNHSCDTITIAGDPTVKATGGTRAAGIGGGDDSKGGTIDIQGGHVEARGLDGASAIGAGESGKDAHVSVYKTSMVVGSGNRRALAHERAAYLQACDHVVIGPCDHGNGHIRAAGADGRTCKFCGSAEACAYAGVEHVAYVDEQGAEQTIADYTDISSSDDFDDREGFSIGDGWYVVKGHRTLNNRLEIAGNVKVILCDGAEAAFDKGIRCERGSLTVYGQKEGSGKLIATSDKRDRAGIGSDKNRDCGTITIVGGTVEATGGLVSAGIGAGQGGGCGTISILGGTVNAKGRKPDSVWNACTCGGGAGIGSADDSKRGGKVSISGGKVTATGGDYAAGIGSGDEAEATVDITITGGQVHAEGGREAAGIGGGNEVAGGNITISGGSVTAVGHDGTTGTGGAGIGGGDKADGGTITITGGTVNASCENDASGIGGGNAGSGGVITIAGDADVTATGLWAGAGIGGGDDGTAGKITITDNAKVNATGGESGAGIGGGDSAGGGDITISGNACVTAKSSDTNGFRKGGAGIGGASGGDGGLITITDNAKVTATGGYPDAAGIGGGNNGNGGVTTISGNAEVNAKGSKNGAGIGGGDNHHGGIITISDHVRVKAEGGYMAAGIGGGDDGASGFIRIDGCDRLEAIGNKTVAIGRGESGGKKGAVVLADGYDVSGEFGGDGKFVKAREFGDGMLIRTPGFTSRALLALCPHVVVEPVEKPAEQQSEQAEPAVGVIAVDESFERIVAPVGIASSEDGSEATVTACELEGYEFQCWRDASVADGGHLNGIMAILSEEATYTYKVAEHPVVCAVYKAVKSEGPATYEGGDPNRVTSPAPDTYEGGDRNRLGDAVCQITISCVDAEKNEIAEAKATDSLRGQAVEVAAPAVDGKTFLRWTDAYGCTLGYGRTLQTTLTGDTRLLAVYGDAAEEARPSITIGEQYCAERGETLGVGVQVTRCVPEGWELLEQGVLYARAHRSPNEKTFTIGASGVSKTVSANTEPNGTTRVVISVSNDSVEVSQRGYMRVRNTATGKEQTLFTDLVTSTYSECAK